MKISARSSVYTSSETIIGLFENCAIFIHFRLKVLLFECKIDLQDSVKIISIMSQDER